MDTHNTDKDGIYPCFTEEIRSLREIRVQKKFFWT